jgi:hypothetical protein
MEEENLRLKKQNMEDAQKMRECEVFAVMFNNTVAEVKNILVMTLCTSASTPTPAVFLCLADWLPSWQGQKRQPKKQCSAQIAQPEMVQPPGCLMQNASRSELSLKSQSLKVTHQSAVTAST